MILGAALLMVGCKKEVNFHGYEGERHVVVMAQMEPDSLVCVNLSYTKFFLDNEKPEAINSADMRLWVNEHEYRPERIVNGNYWFNVRPQVGDSLKMYAHVPNEGELRAKSVMIGKPDIRNVVCYKPKDMEFIHMMDIHYLRFEVYDNAKTEDNYRIEVIGHHERPEYGEDEAIDTVYKEMYVYMDLTEVGDTTKPIWYNSRMASDLFLKDEGWNGEGRQGTLLVYPLVDTARLMRHTYFVRISNYSTEMRKYKYSMMTAGGNMFVEPQRVYTNIEGGLGVFASKSDVICKAILIKNEDTDN